MIIICLVITYVAITLEFIATTNPVFFVGKFVNGFAVGALASVTVSYIGEVGQSRGLLITLLTSNRSLHWLLEESSLACLPWLILWDRLLLPSSSTRLAPLRAVGPTGPSSALSTDLPS